MSDFPPIFDGHNDTLLRLYAPKAGEERSFFERSDGGHIDLPRAREGNLAGGFFAAFVPNPTTTEKPDRFPGTGEDDGGDDEEETVSYTIPLPPALEQSYALNFAMGMVAHLLRLEEESAGEVQIVRDVNALEQCLADGVLAAIMHFEGAEAIDEDLHALRVFYQAGLRSLGLVWSRPNRFAHGVPFAFPADPDTGPGLTADGKRLVKACNELGILIDLSHLNEKGFWDVADLSNAPLVATHSNVHALSPSPRNLTDKQMDAVRASEGVVGLNFHTGFLRKDGRADRETSLDEIVRHAEYMIERMGIDHVAFGSDFDGATMPDDLEDAAGLPRLMQALQDQGYSDGDLRKIAHGNWVRVLQQTWKS